MTPQSLEYKFTLGAWAHEALDTEGQKRPNADLKVEGLVHVQDTVLAWSDANTARRVWAKSQESLKASEHEAEGLLPREVWVWTRPKPIRPPPFNGSLSCTTAKTWSTLRRPTLGWTGGWTRSSIRWCVRVVPARCSSPPLARRSGLQNMALDSAVRATSIG